MDLNKGQFLTLYNLREAQPWLNEKVDDLVNLLYDDCPTAEHRALLVELISRFTYLSNMAYQERLNALADEIITEPGISDDTSQIVAMAADSSADSSQYVLYGLKVALASRGWCQYRQASRFGESYKTYRNSPAHKNIILIDEFIGSGRTVRGRIDEICRVYDRAGVTDYSIRVKVIVATEAGIQLLHKMGINATAQVIVRKGISDFYDAAVTAKNIALMKEIESVLSDQFHADPDMSLGYMQSEVLYTRQEGNTPNNVFPVFWWGRYRSNTVRPVICSRAQDYS